MARFVALLVALCGYFSSGPVLADDASRLVGSWKLSSWTIQIVGGDATEPFGPNPKGRALFTPDGFAAFIIVGANRKPATNSEEAAALLKSLNVYTGKFSIDGDKFTTKVDMSANELLTGQDQLRFFKLEGDRLSIRTAEQVSSVGMYQGKKVVGSRQRRSDEGTIICKARQGRSSWSWSILIVSPAAIARSSQLRRLISLR